MISKILNKVGSLSITPAKIFVVIVNPEIIIELSPITILLTIA